uniref:Protein kinase domain-containing protein n=3 Tax=Brassica oleracea var. oleracea TaxID=109376 RepID=A0A0D3BWV1_BRAOL
MSFSSCKQKFTLKWTIWYHITYHSKSDKALSSGLVRKQVDRRSAWIFSQYGFLVFIDLSNNSLSGPVPQALLDRKNEGLALKKQSRREALRPSIETVKRRFSYSEVMAMTNNFQKIFGEGGLGIIYQGYLNGIEQVAVKVELLMRVHHINLVSLAGYCDERDHLALAYEYMAMANRDLKEHLSGKEGSSFLDWQSRLRIAAETALGLNHLHTGCKPPMYHRDVKSTNVLLNEDFQAKLCDFGLSRSFPIGSETHVSTVVVGTPGFLDPEYYLTHRLSEKSDVYSFGIVLLEIITNQLVIDQTRENPHIAEWVRFLLTSGDIESVMDPDLKGDYGSDSARKVLELAMSCSRLSSAERPNMAQVVHELNECLMYEKSRRGNSQDVSSK